MRLLVLLLFLAMLVLVPATVGMVIGGHEPTAWATALAGLVMMVIIGLVTKND